MVGVMTVGVMSVGEITVGVMTVGVMTVRVMRRLHCNTSFMRESADNKSFNNSMTKFISIMDF